MLSLGGVLLGIMIIVALIALYMIVALLLGLPLPFHVVGTR